MNMVVWLWNAVTDLTGLGPFVRIAMVATAVFGGLGVWDYFDDREVARKARSQLAEETRLIVRIGELVLADAIREASHWPDHLSVSVNISGIELRHGDLVEAVQHHLNARGLDPARLELEFTESTLLEIVPDGLATLEELHALGVQLTVDDVGAARSSLTRLHSLPLSKAKLDMSSLGQSSDGGSAALLEAIVRFVENAGVRAVAENVEQEDDLLSARLSGCVEAQGYLLGHAISKEDALRLVHSNCETSTNPILEVP